MILGTSILDRSPYSPPPSLSPSFIFSPPPLLPLPSPRLPPSPLPPPRAKGHLAEFWWNKQAKKWKWIDHGFPKMGSATKSEPLASAPGALITSRSMFVVTAGGLLYERHFDGSRWVWVKHG